MKEALRKLQRAAGIIAHGKFKKDYGGSFVDSRSDIAAVFAVIIAISIDVWVLSVPCSHI